MGEDWGKLIVAKGIKKLPKVQNIAQSGHTACKLLIITLKFIIFITPLVDFVGVTSAHGPSPQFYNLIVIGNGSNKLAAAYLFTVKNKPA